MRKNISERGRREGLGEGLSSTNLNGLPRVKDKANPLSCHSSSSLLCYPCIFISISRLSGGIYTDKYLQENNVYNIPTAGFRRLKAFITRQDRTFLLRGRG